MIFDDLKWVHLSDAVFFLLLPVAAVLSVRAKSISVGGALTGMAIVVGLYLGGSWLGAALLAIFFVAGSFATKWKQEAKISMGVAQESEGQRGWVNAASNVAVAAFLTIPTFAVKADNAPVAVCCCGKECKCLDCSCIDGSCTSCNCPACSCAACGCGEDCGSGTSLDAIKAKDCCKEKARAVPATGADGQAACCKS